MRKLLTALAVLCTLATPALALDPGEMFADPAQEQRARDIGRQLRCLVCQNQSIFDSNAGLAKDLRVVVRERMVAGDTDAEVLEYVRVRFGDYVLLNPRVAGQTLVLWGAPVAFLLLGGLGLAAYLRRPADAPPQDDLTEAELSQARALLNRETL